MRGLLAPLSDHEEVALRRIGFAVPIGWSAPHVRRLLLGHSSAP